MLKEPKIKSGKHRRFISTLECLVCGIQGMTQAAHIRVGNQAGMGLKSGDNHCVPLCVRCHRESHETSEKKYWGSNLEKTQKLALALYSVSGDEDKAITLIHRWRA